MDEERFLLSYRFFKNVINKLINHDYEYPMNKVEKFKLKQKDRLAEWSKARIGDLGVREGEVVGSNPGGGAEKGEKISFFLFFFFV